jgi:hypothetical protein
VTDIEVPVDAAMDLRITIMEPPSIFTHRAVVRWCRQLQPEGVWRAGVEFKPESQQIALEWRELVRVLKQSGDRRRPRDGPRPACAARAATA